MQGGGFAAGSGSIFLDDVNCAGTEERLVTCPRLNSGIPNCVHAEDAGVRCPRPISKTDETNI